MKKIKYLLLISVIFIVSGCSISDIDQKLDISEIDKTIILVCLGVIAISTLIIIIVLLTKMNDKKKIEIEDDMENLEDSNK